MEFGLYSIKTTSDCVQQCWYNDDSAYTNIVDRNSSVLLIIFVIDWRRRIRYSRCAKPCCCYTWPACRYLCSCPAWQLVDYVCVSKCVCHLLIKNYFTFYFTFTNYLNRVGDVVAANAVALTLADILGRSDTDSEGPCNRQRVQLSSTEEYGTRIPREACERLELKEIYNEKFLLCHALVGGIDICVCMSDSSSSLYSPQVIVDKA